MTNRRHNRFPIGLVNLIRIFNKHKLIFLPWPTKNNSVAIYLLVKLLKMMRRSPTKSDGQRLREALTELGPVYIKLGQLLSTRSDIFGANVASELALLQDHVPPAKEFNVRSFINSQQFDDQLALSEISEFPIASASIAQIYTGTLVDGSNVILKIVRPGIEDAIRENMALLSTLARITHNLVPSIRRFHLPKLMRDQEKVMLRETDMHSESRNQIQLRRNFADSDLLYVPRVHTDYTRSNLLVMEQIEGVSIRQITELKNKQVDLKTLAHKGVETFFTQVFEHNFFHADMHPGNIFIDVKEPQNPKYIALDCAIIGSLSEQDKLYIAKSVYLFFQRDYLGIALLQIDCGWVSATTDANRFADDIKELCEPIFGQPLSKIYFAKFLLDLFEIAKDFDMEIQPQLVLLQKTLFYVEGVGRELYPELDLWTTAKPFINKWISNHFGINAQIQTLLTDASANLQGVLEIPGHAKKTDETIRQLKKELALQKQSIQHLQETGRNQLWKRRLARLGGFSAMALALINLSKIVPITEVLNNWLIYLNAILLLIGLVMLLKK